MNCVIFGAGAWGTAMAIHLDGLQNQLQIARERDSRCIRKPYQRLRRQKPREYCERSHHVSVRQHDLLSPCRYPSE